METSENKDHIVHRNLEYAKMDNHSLLLDLYIPHEGIAPRPLIVWIHGGAWRAGSKEHCPARMLLNEGFAVASINYRLSHQATFPAQIHDCKAAIRWLRAHAEDYDIDSQRIGAWGSSAGGHLVALLGTSGGVKALEGDLGHLDQPSNVQAVCDWFGPTDFLQMDEHALPGSKLKHLDPKSPESLLIGGPVLENKDKCRMANPITYIDENDPPFLIVHGDQDRTVPPHQSKIFHQALEKAGVKSELIMVEGAGHGGFGSEIRDKVKVFFKKQFLKE